MRLACIWAGVGRDGDKGQESGWLDLPERTLSLDFGIRAVVESKEKRLKSNGGGFEEKALCCYVHRSDAG